MQIAETSEGHLFATIRNNTLPQTGVRFFNTSRDGGETWGTPYCETTNQPGLPDPKCQASLIRAFGAGGRAALLLANAADPSERKHLTLRASYDDGHTWPASNTVYAGSAAYSAMTIITSGDLGLLFERDKYKQICFARIPIE